MNWFENLTPVIQAMLATIFTWGVTSLGAVVVFFFKEMNKRVLDTILGFSGGVMIAASFWSLLAPAIELSEELGYIVWLLPTIGFIAGGLFVLLSDTFLDQVLKSKKDFKDATSLKRSILLISAITIHNIPEGMAIGVAFGSIIYGLDGATTTTACILALGIGIQNFPEGTAVSLPLLREGFSRKKAFFLGQLSGIVEPIAGVLGAILVIKVRYLLPYLLAFAAGAMIYVVVQELIPESQTNKKKELMALFTLIGFSLMMILDVALG